MPSSKSNKENYCIMTNNNNKWEGPFLPCGGFFNNLRQKATQLIWHPPRPPLEAIEILKRLQREAFADLMKMRGKLEMIEKQFTLYLSNTRGSLTGGAKTQLKGEIKVGGAFLIMQNESSQESHSLVEHARMKTGTEVKFTFETFFRERDLLVTECIADQSCMSAGDVIGGRLTLGKILYSANIKITCHCQLFQ